MPSLRESEERERSKRKKDKHDKHRRHRSRSRRRSKSRDRRSSRDRNRDDYSYRGDRDRDGYQASSSHRYRGARYRRSGSRNEDWRRGGRTPSPQAFGGAGKTGDMKNEKVDEFIMSLVPFESGALVKKRERKSRWADPDDKEKVVGVPTILPANLTPEAQRAILLQLQIEELGKKLISGKLGIPERIEERSPSPEPIYNNLGVRVNTREVRTRKRIEEQRHSMIGELIKLNPKYIPPLDYRPLAAKYIDKVWIPQEEFPSVNFVGLIIGPRGTTLKQLEKETGAKIIIRGKGSMKDGKMGRPDGMPLPGADEPLHAYITAQTDECLRKAMDLITRIVREAVEVPETENELRKNQLKQLALINGTLRDGGTLGLTGNSSASIMAMIGNANSITRCGQCGSESHKTWQCPEANLTSQFYCYLCGGRGHIPSDCKSGVKEATATSTLDKEYMSLMAELGQNPLLEGAPLPPGLASGPPLSGGTAPPPPPSTGLSASDEMLLRNFPNYTPAQLAALQHAGIVPRRLESITPLVKKVIEKHKGSHYEGERYEPAPGPYSSNPMYEGGGGTSSSFMGGASNAGNNMGNMNNPANNCMPTLLPAPLGGIPSLMSINPNDPNNENKSYDDEYDDSDNRREDEDDLNDIDDHYHHDPPPGLNIPGQSFASDAPPPSMDNNFNNPNQFQNQNQFSMSSMGNSMGNMQNNNNSYMMQANGPPGLFPTQHHHHQSGMGMGMNMGLGSSGMYPPPPPGSQSSNPWMMKPSMMIPPGPPGTSYPHSFMTGPPPPPPGTTFGEPSLPPPPLPGLTGFSLDDNQPLPPDSPPPGL